VSRDERKHGSRTSKTRRDVRTSESRNNIPILLPSVCWNYKVIRSQRRCLKGLFDDRDDADDEY